MRAHAARTEGEVAILSRLIQPERSDLHPEAARSILKLGFSDQDHARMHDLTVKSQQGVLGDAEQESLENYRVPSATVRSSARGPATPRA
jgi:hypothetical protein